jgi:hypothetical protein
MFEHLDDPDPPGPDDAARGAVRRRAAQLAWRRRLIVGGSAAAVILAASLTALALPSTDHQRTKVATKPPGNPPPTIAATPLPPVTVPTPPLACAALNPTDAPKGVRRTASVALGDLTVTMSGLANTAFSAYPTLDGPTLVITRAGATSVSQPIAPLPNASPTDVVAPIIPWGISGGDAFSTSSSPLCLARFPGQAAPVVLLGLDWGGAHCCTWVRAIDTERGTSIEEDLGNPTATVLADGDHAIIVTADNAFAYAFSSFAGSGMPLLVQQVSSGTFVDVTRSHPDLLKADASKWWTAFNANPTDTLGVLAAWVGDECLLGQRQAAFATVDQLQAQGKLNQAAPFPSGGAFVAQLRAFLSQHGYC